jgi:hypothetical protein
MENKIEVGDTVEILINQDSFSKIGTIREIKPSILKPGFIYRTDEHPCFFYIDEIKKIKYKDN